MKGSFKGLIFILVLFCAFDNSFSNLEKNQVEQKASLSVQVKQYLKSNKVSSAIIGLISSIVLFETFYILFTNKRKKSFIKKEVVLDLLNKKGRLIFRPSEHYVLNKSLDECPEEFRDYYQVFLRDFDIKNNPPDYRTKFNACLVYESEGNIVEEMIYSDPCAGTSSATIYKFILYPQGFFNKELEKIKGND